MAACSAVAGVALEPCGQPGAQQPIDGEPAAALGERGALVGAGQQGDVALELLALVVGQGVVPRAAEGAERWIHALGLIAEGLAGEHADDFEQAVSALRIAVLAFVEVEGGDLFFGEACGAGLLFGHGGVPLMV